MSSFLFPRECVILDACCVISLYASGHMADILATIPTQVAVAAYVCNVEARRIYTGPLEDVTRETTSINLQPFIDDKLIRIVSPENESEENSIVNFSATSIDSGEAISAAIALHRCWSLGTDDRDVISFFMKGIPQLHLISTPDLLKYWVDATHPQLTLIRTILENIRIRARYKPHEEHHLYRWWKQYSHIQKT